MVKYPFLDLRDTNAPYAAELHRAAARVIDSGRYIGGPEVEALEGSMARLSGVRHAVGVSNGLDALRLIFRALIQLGRLKPGDVVAIPANTYIATFLAASDAGLVILPLLPSEATMNLDVDALEAALPPEVKAVVPVHLYGRPVEGEPLLRLARSRGLEVIEDAAQAVGAPGVGLTGHAAYSFYPTKNVGALGDAGMVTTDDPEVAQAVRALANYGADRRYHNIYRGFNCRLDPMQAALIGVKLAHVAQENAARRGKALLYSSLINNPDILAPADVPEHVYHQYVVRVAPDADRDLWRRRLLERGVETDIHYAVPPHLQPCYRGVFDDAALEPVVRMADTLVSLPLGPGTSIDDVAEISQIINQTSARP